MTAPWLPLPNPGGSTRMAVRSILQAHLIGAGIPGVSTVLRSLPLTWDLEEMATGSLFSTGIAIQVGRVVHRRRADTGPTDPGGKDASHECALVIVHRCYSPEPSDWADAEDDHDRIVGAIIDQLAANGRDLGRPDVILQAADWPDESLTYETGEPVWDNGVREQSTIMEFVVSIYMQRQP
jgi:hypothetical protein